MFLSLCSLLFSAGSKEANGDTHKSTKQEDRERTSHIKAKVLNDFSIQLITQCSNKTDNPSLEGTSSSKDRGKSNKDC